MTQFILSARDRDGHIFSLGGFTAAGDEEAKKEAARLLNEHGNSQPPDAVPLATAALTTDDHRVVADTPVEDYIKLL